MPDKMRIETKLNEVWAADASHRFDGLESKKTTRRQSLSHLTPSANGNTDGGA
jgi:hypothetical protein